MLSGMADHADIEEFAGAVMALVHLINRGQARAFDPALVAVTQLLSDGRPRPPSEIADALGSPRYAVSRRIQELRGAGKVEIEPDPRDGRSYQVSLTPAGRHELDELTAKGLALFASWVSHWTTEEIRTFSALARRLTDGAEKVRGERRRPPWWRERG